MEERGATKRELVYNFLVFKYLPQFNKIKKSIFIAFNHGHIGVNNKTC